jgi:hypothetical protein
MKKSVKFISGRCLADEAGQALILVLVFLLLGSLILPPALAHISTTLKTGKLYEDKTDTLNSADAGIEDGLWRIQYNVLGPSYDIYDFTTNWSYQTDNVNRMTAEETVRNIWVPNNVTLDDFELNAQSARTMIESDRLVVSGTAGAVPGEPYRITIDFNPAIKVDPTADPAASDNLTIVSVGVWLPQGFTYISGNSSLEEDGPLPDSITVSPHCGGQAVVWSYDSPYPLFTSFPNFVSDNGTLTSTIYFGYNPLQEDPTKMPAAVAWVTTSTDSGETVNDVPLVWDTDTRIYKITSAAGNTDIEAYSSKNEIRNMGDAASGDYVAVGNSLMIDSDHKPPPDHGVRNQLLASSDATVSTIPADGDVLNAYLYWSGYRSDMTVFSDTCTSSNLTNSWVNGGDWTYDSSGNKFYKGNHTGADSRRYLTVKNSQPLNSYPSGTIIEVSWSQSVATTSTTVFSDNCNSQSNLTTYWLNGGDWGYNSGTYRGQHTGVDNATRYLTLKNGQNLNAYGNGTITVSWTQTKTGTITSSDGLDYAYSTDDGSTWSSNITAFRGPNCTPSSYSYTISSQDLTNVKFKLRFYLVGMGSGKYCNLDDIAISVTPTYTAADGLDFGLYNGTSWSNYQAFQGDIGSSWVDYYYRTTDTQYLNANFKLRFYIVGMNGAGHYCNIDNIAIIVRPPDNLITFKINDVQYSLTDNGTPQAGGELTAGESSVIVNSSGYSYACYRKVTALVQKYPMDGLPHHTGNYKYTVGGVQATTSNELSYAGWSIIIVYSSPDTAGHYLYLRDIFSYTSGHQDLDFDNDGIGGGDVSGFIIPEPLRDRFGVIQDPVCAHLTAFVGEGDWCYSGDFIALNAPEEYREDPADIPNEYKLFDGKTLAATTTGGGDPGKPNNASQPDNVWNSQSVGMSEDGVDIDTFEITWASQLLKPGDNKLHLDLYTYIDNFNTIYLIISVKSKTVTGGTGHYVIYGS